jgi:glycerol uptake facilitator-like aquaporin
LARVAPLPSLDDVVYRALAAEVLGSMLLAATVIGSGMMAQRLAGGNLAVALLANAAATVALLATLIALFGPISGAHFNPAVSIVETIRRKLTLQQAAGYVTVQIAGCCLGAPLAHAMFELPLIQASTHLRSGPALWLSEAVATAGLILVVIGSSGPNDAAWRVSAWIGAAWISFYSHSIVSGTYKRLKNDDFLSARTQLTVRFAVKKCRLVPIDGDRWRTIPVGHIAGFTTIRKKTVSTPVNAGQPR